MDRGQDTCLLSSLCSSAYSYRNQSQLLILPQKKLTGFLWRDFSGTGISIKRKYNAHATVSFLYEHLSLYFKIVGCLNADESKDNCEFVDPLSLY